MPIGIRVQADRELRMNKPTLNIPLDIKGLSEKEFEGHGSAFGNVDLGGDVVIPGAFTKTLAKHEKSGTLPQMFWMHNPEKVPGKWLSISEDEYGLKVKGKLFDTPLGKEIHTLMKEGAVATLSIGYQTKDWDYDKDGNRLLKEIDLWEVSPVSLAMNPLAQIAHVKTQMSERGEYVPSIREFERTLRDVGCSKTVAKRIIAKVYEGEEKPSGPSDSLREGEQELMEAAQKLNEQFFVGCIRPITFS